MMGLRRGDFDVLVGVNLLREGLDLPEVQLVAILDADKEGFLRSERSLTQTAGRAARNAGSKVIMYADKITDSMRKTIDETQRRREKQMAYNQEHGIVPKTIVKPLDTAWGDYKVSEEHIRNVAEEKVAVYRSPKDIKKAIQDAKKEMEKAVKELDFINAAKYRDVVIALEEKLNKI
jgi:excinuclease ABC subunit B